MNKDLEVRCLCGSLRGVARGVSPAKVNRAKCYCDDCQLFAFFLDRTDDVLDEAGGTEIYQMAPSRLEITDGREHLACVRLKPKGLYRWYAGCCNTPLANTLTGAVPFVGLINPILTDASDENVGPIRMRVHGRFARGGAAAAGAHPKAPLGAVFKILGKLVGRRLKGEHRRHPLFDPDTNQAIVKPRVLEPAELAALRQSRERWMESS